MSIPFGAWLTKPLQVIAAKREKRIRRQIFQRDENAETKGCAEMSSRLVVTTEERFQSAGGIAASHYMTYERYWKRFLQGFDEIIILARVFPGGDSGLSPVEGPGVRVAALPPYSGILGFLRHRWEIQRVINAYCSREFSYLLHVPGVIGGVLGGRLIQQEIPFAVQVIGDPFDVFAPRASRHPLRAALRWRGTRLLRNMCAHAAAAAYVTKEQLQRRYPPREGAFTTSFSNVHLPDDAFVTASRPPRPRTGPWRIVTIGSLQQPYKGVDVLVEAVARCRKHGIDVELVVIGDGILRPRLEELAVRVGIAEHVKFLGRLPSGAPIREQLDASDLFVLASRTEGLPRAMIEAMARGLPCLGTFVGGIPELLPADALVPPGDSFMLADRLCGVFSNANELKRMGDANLQVAKNYHRDVLDARRKEFLMQVRRLSPGCVQEERAAA